MITRGYIDELSYKIIGCAIKVHRELGPGLLESLYQRCLMIELAELGLIFENQKSIDINYLGYILPAEFRYDVLVEDLIIVELKSIEAILPVHEAQLLTYMKLLEKPKGILINFHCTNIFREGQKTLVNKYYGSFPP